MASSFARALIPLARPARPSRSVCARCRRTFVSSPALQAGHNKWSKIRHDKAVNDAKKNATRNLFAKNITLYSKLYGPDPNFNPQLATAIAAAKKAGVPKDRIEAAIARGQGKSSEGKALESLTFEAVMPPSLALIVEVETESKLFVLQELNSMVKKRNGSASASKFFFTRRGRVVFEKNDKGIDVDQIMDDAIEAGAEDLGNDEDGNIVVWTEPTETMHLCKTIASKFGLKVLESDIIWQPNEETMAKLDASEAQVEFRKLLRDIKSLPDVQAIYSNVTRGAISDEEWDKIEEYLDS